MLGSDGEPGVCARALGDLFQAIEDAGGDTEYEVSMSYLEVWGGERGRPLSNKGRGQRAAQPQAGGFTPRRAAAQDPVCPPATRDVPSSHRPPRSTTRRCGTC